MTKMMVMGRPVGEKYIKSMKMIFGLLAVLLLIVSFYVLFTFGPTKLWSVVLGFGILFSMCSYWVVASKRINEIESKNHKARNFQKTYSGIILVVLIVLIFVLGSAGQSVLQQSPHFQITVLGGIIVLIAIVQYYFWYVNNLGRRNR